MNINDMTRKQFEEQERYYSLIDCNGNFELRDYGSNREFHSLYELDDLLNQQDNRIKELENMNSLYLDSENHFCDVVKRLNQEKQQLKQSQKQLAIRELEKVKNYFDDSDDDNYHESEGWIITNRSVVEYIDDKIKELKGEE